MVGVNLLARYILDSRTVFRPIQDNHISPHPVGLFGRLIGRTAREKVIDNLLDYIPKKGQGSYSISSLYTLSARS